MPIKAALIVLAVIAPTLAGCQSDDTTVSAPPSVAPTTAPTTAPPPNGIDRLGADEILKRARAALTEAKSYRAKGTVHLDGEKTAIDLQVSGRNLIGSVSFGKATVDLLAVGGKRYVRPNKQFWIESTTTRQGTALTRALGDRWVAGADKEPAFADLFTIVTLDRLFRPERFDIGAVKEIDGVRAVGLMDFDDIEKKLFVATTGKPYPVQLIGQGGAVLGFSDFGVIVTGLAAPAKSKVVDLAKLTG